MCCTENVDTETWIGHSIQMFELAGRTRKVDVVDGEKDEAFYSLNQRN
jgi:hypothetical protein